MKLKLKTAPTAEPISLNEAKLHLRLATTTAGAEAYTTEDDLLNRLIKTARRQAEWETGRALITQTWYGYLDSFPDGDHILIPLPPLVSATITYKDYDGNSDTFTDFDTDVAAQWGRLVLKPGKSWPTDTLYPTNPITVEFICGYGAAGSNVPEDIRAAMLLMISDLYENRGEVVVGVKPERINRAIASLLDFYRIRRVYG